MTQVKPRLRTHYDNLKVARDAPVEVIKAAYKSLSAKYHPDRNSSPDAQRIMKIVNDSYQVLLNPEKRNKHDGWIAAQEEKSVSQKIRNNAQQARENTGKSTAFKSITSIQSRLSYQFKAALSFIAGASVVTIGIYYAYDSGSAHTAVQSVQSFFRPDLVANFNAGPSNVVAGQDLAEVKNNLSVVQQFKSDMVELEPGSFNMGSSTGLSIEHPVHRVDIARLTISKYEVTFSQWELCVQSGGCSRLPDDEGWGRGRRPVMNISYAEIEREFIPWLNSLSELKFRLPSEAEWEYAARSGTVSEYSWGDLYVDGRANCSTACDDQFRTTSPVGSFNANSFGLYDMHGNVWEWTADCYNESYAGAPADGSAWVTGNCSRRVTRGGSWGSDAADLRSTARTSFDVGASYYSLGFRLVLQN